MKPTLNYGVHKRRQYHLISVQKGISIEWEQTKELKLWLHFLPPASLLALKSIGGGWGAGSGHDEGENIHL